MQLFQKQIFLVADTAASWYAAHFQVHIWCTGCFALDISNAPVCPKRAPGATHTFFTNSKAYVMTCPCWWGADQTKTVFDTHQLIFTFTLFNKRLPWKNRSPWSSPNSSVLLWAIRANQPLPKLLITNAIQYAHFLLPSCVIAEQSHGEMHWQCHGCNQEATQWGCDSWSPRVTSS